MSGSGMALAPIDLGLFQLGFLSHSWFLIGIYALHFDFSEIYYFQSIRVNMDFIYCPQSRHNRWQSVTSETFYFLCNHSMWYILLGVGEIISPYLYFFCLILLPLLGWEPQAPSLLLQRLPEQRDPVFTTAVFCYHLSHWKWPLWSSGYLLMVSSLFVELSRNFYNWQ